MTIQECYIQMKANYEGVLSRLGAESRVTKFLQKLLNDSTFDNLNNAIIRKDFKAAFVASHTLKGISMNLGLTWLEETSNKLTEALRNNSIEEDIETIFLAVQEAYENTIASIQEFAINQQNEKLGDE